MNFSNLVFASINKGMHKPVFKQFLHEDKKECIKDKPIINDSRLDSVNISVAESCDSILDMSPNIWKLESSKMIFYWVI